MSSFDEDLALAISLSLQEQQQSQASNSRDDPILVIDSSDDEQPPTVPRKLPMNKPSTSKSASKPSSSRRPATQPASSQKPKAQPELAKLDEIIDLDTTIEIGKDTAAEEEDTATEDESDEEPPVSKPRTLARPSSPIKKQSGGAATGGSKATPKLAPASLDPMAAFRAERAKMEQERLARLKRTRPDVEEKRGLDDDSDVEERPPKRPSPSSASSSATSIKGKSKATTSFTDSFGTPDKSGFFWHGAIRQTANKHATPSLDTKPVFRLTEILPPPNLPSSDPNQILSFAIVSSYAVDLPWLYQLFSPEVPVILVAQPGTDGRPEVHHALPGWVRASPGLAGGRGCMHVKLMLLFYKSGRLRIVIPTANFIPHDWRDIENSVWLQDIPLRSSSTPAPAPPVPSRSTPGIGMESFAERLEYVLKSLNVGPALEAHLIDQRRDGEVTLPLRNIDELHARWDWSRVTAYLVPSIAGKHTGWQNVIRNGHIALMKAIRDMGAASDSVKIECQGSSIGSYSTAWTNEFISSARGISPEKWLDTPKTRRSKAPHPNSLKIVFPSLATVDASVLGRPGGGTIFCRKQQWDASTFPKELFLDSNSKRGKILMHSKMILGLLSEEGKPPGWLYVGSHNFTPSAWGNLSGTGFTPVMNITNYELGVVVRLESANQGEVLACWKRPARPYVIGKDVPWMQNEHM